MTVGNHLRFVFAVSYSSASEIFDRRAKLHMNYVVAMMVRAELDLTKK
jgi:hypothetical protein